MRKSIIALLIALAMVSVVVPVSSEPIAYGHNWGRGSYDVATAVETDASGNIYIAGITTDTTLGRELGFLAKYDPFGSLVWDVAMDCGAPTKVMDMAISQTGELYVLGDTMDGWLAKVSNSGSLLYAKTLDGIDSPYRIAYDSATDGVVVVGDSSSYGDAVVAAFNPDGSLRWSTESLSPEIVSPWGVSVGPSGDVYIICDRTYGNDVGIAMLSSSGQLVKQVIFSSLEPEYSWDIAVDQQGNVYAMGYEMDDGSNLFAKFTSSLDHIWTEIIAGSYSWRECFRLSVVSDGSLYAVGDGTDSTGSLFGSVVLHLTSDGSLADSSFYYCDSISYAWFWDAVPVLGGGLVIAGSSFGTPNLTPVPLSDLYVVQATQGWATDGVLWSASSLSVSLSPLTLLSVDAFVDNYDPAMGDQAWFGVVAVSQLNVSIDARASSQNPNKVSFRGSVADGDKPFSFLWSFGDGTTDTAKRTTHTYTTPGIFGILLTVRDSTGKVGFASTTVTIQGPPVVANLTCRPYPAVVGYWTYFVAEAYDPDGGELSYAWDFGDGTSVMTTEPWTDHIYSAIGDLTLSLTVTDDEGMSASGEMLVPVIYRPNSPPIPSIYWYPDPLVGQVVTFDASGSYDPDYGDFVAFYAWDFGDGVGAIGVLTSHIYTSPGYYVVQLSISDSLGVGAWTSVQIWVSAVSDGDSYEPDDVYTDATWMMLGTVQTHSLHNNGSDVDWIAFNLSEFDTVRIQTSGPPQDYTDTMIYLYDAYGVPTNPLAYDDDGGDDLWSRLIISLSPGIYYVKVTTYSAGWDIETYNLTLASSGPNILPDLVMLSVDADGNVITATAYNQGEDSVMNQFYIDVFVDPETTPAVGQTGNMFMDFYWLGIGESVMASFENTGYYGTHTFYAIVDTDMLVTESDESNNLIGPIVINITPPVAAPDSYEPDDNYTQASVVGLGTSQAHSIHNNGSDVDWIALVVNDTCNVTLWTNGLFGDTVMYVYNQSGTQGGPFAWDDNGGANNWSMISLVQLPAGTYYVMIEENGNDEQILSYTFTALAAGERKTWTFMVYLDGDNNLEDVGLVDFNEMSSVGSSAEVNIVVEMDRVPGYSFDYGDWTGTKRFYVTQAMTPDSWNAVMDLGERNMGSPDTLTDFIAWSVTSYPADNYALVLWDHGGGWDGAVCWDETNSFDALSMNEVEIGISAAEGLTGARINLLAFDACLMGMVEVAYEVIECVDAITFSEETVPWDGFPYNMIMMDLVANPQMLVSDLADAIVLRYMEYYGYAGSETMSSLSVSAAYPSMYAALELFTQELIMACESYRDEIAIAAFSSESFGGGYLDMYDFAARVSSSVPVASLQYAASVLMNATEMALTSEGHGNAHSGAHGLSIYLPIAGYSPSYNALDFAADFSWNEFLDTMSHVDPDMYEPDDFYTQATQIQAGETQTHSIHTQSDVDWFTFQVVDYNATVRVCTSGPPGVWTDTELWLYDSYGVPYSSFAYDDDSGGNGWSFIQLSLATGTYYAKITSYTMSSVLPTYSLSLYIGELPNVPPIAYFEVWPYNPSVGAPALFDGGYSYDQDGWIVDWLWDMGDGSQYNGTSWVNHTYNAPGNYTVTLIVIDNVGAWSQYTHEVYVVYNQPPLAVMACYPQNPDPWESVYFTAEGSHDPDGYIAYLRWDFGDGTGSWDWYTWHYYGVGGDFNVTLTVIDNSGAMANASMVVHVRLPPVAVITVSPEIGKAGTPMLFDGSASYCPGNGSITDYYWWFSDGGSATGPVVEHVFQLPGVYDANLTVVDEFGSYGGDWVQVTVVAAVGPVAIIAYSPPDPVVGQTVWFDANNSVDPDGSIATCIWQFGDGVVETGAQVSHSYIHSGTYQVKLTVIDEDGLADDDTVPLLVMSVPTADFTWSPQELVVGQQITFSAVGSYDESGIREYVWSFGDGTYASGWQTTHSYSASGVYQVTLTVTNNYGVLRSVMKEVTVSGALSEMGTVPEQSGDPSSAAVAEAGLSMTGLVSPLNVLVVLVLLLMSVTIGDVARSIRTRR